MILQRARSCLSLDSTSTYELNRFLNTADADGHRSRDDIASCIYGQVLIPYAYAHSTHMRAGEPDAVCSTARIEMRTQDS